MEKKKSPLLKVNEIFYSLQGEGLAVGEPSIFIRLQGCNLNCTYCDTKYAQDPRGKYLITVDDVMEIVLDKIKDSAPGKRWACITGGEPLTQSKHLSELIRQLHEKRFLVEVETNGSFTRPIWWERVDSWVADIKCPSSGHRTSMGTTTIWLNGRDHDQVKFVVGDGRDLNFVRNLITEPIGARKDFHPIILVSPAANEHANFDQAWLEEVVEFCKELNVRFSLQIHKVIWGNKLGV